MHVGKGLYYTKIERALQECSDNFLGLQNIETSIFIEAGVYKPSSTLRSTIFGETSTINFIGEGVDETIIECNNLSRLIGLEMNNKYSNHIWTFKNMTLVGCKNNFETAKVMLIIYNQHSIYLFYINFISILLLMISSFIYFYFINIYMYLN